MPLNLGSCLKIKDSSHCEMALNVQPVDSSDKTAALNVLIKSSKA